MKRIITDPVESVNFLYLRFMENVIKEYTNGEITVVWESRNCIHSRICWEKATGLPEVFDPQERPWINMEGASTGKIITQVNKCPSGALSYFWNSEENSAEETAAETTSGDATKTVIYIMNNGPLLVSGNITVKDEDGTETQKTNMTSFCRCSASKTYPYCDGTHQDNNFQG
ncbi:MAG: (4Fe-4S)-binding protein [Bacteroidota bacterium]